MMTQVLEECSKLISVGAKLYSQRMFLCNDDVMCKCLYVCRDVIVCNVLEGRCQVCTRVIASKTRVQCGLIRLGTIWEFR